MMRKQEIIIRERIASKKNSKQVYCRGNRPIVTASSAYKKFRDRALSQIATQFDGEVLCGPLSVSYIFHIKGNYDIDIDNAIASVNDVLQDAGVIEDDAMIEDIVLTKKRNGFEEWATYVTIIEK